eukprot:scaffold3614_cov123-Isochrysis_galbana.AAC.6
MDKAQVSPSLASSPLASSPSLSPANELMKTLVAPFAGSRAGGFFSAAAPLVAVEALRLTTLVFAARADFDPAMSAAMSPAGRARFLESAARPSDACGLDSAAKVSPLPVGVSNRCPGERVGAASNS